jgi:ligand-binding sensor domain-containing protein/uncharacterized membrane-anchored protein YhcB (DUF1043 family)
MKYFFHTILVLVVTNVCFAQQQYTFTNYTEEQGLPSGTIRAMFKDSTGYLWLCSESGVSRFDGYSFKVFRHNPDDSTTIHDNSVWFGAQLVNGDIVFPLDRNALIYKPEKFSFNTKTVFSNLGVPMKSFQLKNDSAACYYFSVDSMARVYKSQCEYWAVPGKKPRKNLNVTTDLISRVLVTINWEAYMFNIADAGFKKISVCDAAGVTDSVRDVVYDKTKNNFIIIGKKHLFRYSAAENKFVPYFDLSPSFKDIRNSLIVDFTSFFDKDLYYDTYFALTRQGELYKVNIRTGEEKLVKLNTKIPDDEIKDKTFSHYITEKNGWVWLSSSAMGLFHVNLVTNQCEQFIHEQGNSQSIPSNNILWAVCDTDGVVWISCQGHGLVKMEEVIPVMESASPAYGKSKMNSGGDGNNIRTFLETETGYWIGTLKGLYSYDKNKNQFTELNTLVPTDGIDDGHIGTLGRDNLGNIWIGTWHKDLIVYNPKNNKRISHYMPQLHWPDVWMFRDLFCDSRNIMWISTFTQGTYTINIHDIDFDNPASLKLNRIVCDEKDSSTISSNTVFVFAEDADGNIWAGSENGLNRYNPSTKKWTRFYNIPGDAKSLHGNNVRSLAFDKKGNLWIGTSGGGLNRYNKASTDFSHFTIENGLPNDEIYTILCDKGGMLWMGTNHGLCRFNPDDYSCSNFSPKDGIQDYEFNTKAALKLKDGTLLFGGVDGYNIINPEKIEINKAAAPKVIISSIKIFDREIPPGDGSFKLKHTENSLSFEFAALSFYHNQDNRYAYKMEPLNSEWIFCNDRRFVSYSNLEPGEYIFRVKACNSDGVWNEAGTQLSITITPPWWKTVWAKILFAFLTIGIAVGYYRYRTHALRVKQKELESEVNKATIELRKKNRELEAALENLKSTQEQLIQSEKLAAFGTMATRMAHEIQNPLNFVNNFSEISKQLMNDISNETATEKEKLEAMSLLNGNLEKIYHHGKRASVIIKQLQDHTRAGTTHEFFQDDEIKK